MRSEWHSCSPPPASHCGGPRSLNCRKFVHPNPRTDPSRDIAEMPVMRQIYDLPNVSHIGQQPDRFFGTEIVERLHDVIGNERNWRTHSRELVVTRDPQRQIELEPCAL